MTAGLPFTYRQCTAAMLQWRALVLLVLIAAGRGSPLARPPVPAGPAANASSAAGRDDVIYRLDQKVIPSHYEIELTPVYPNTGLSAITEFGGEVTILAKVVEATKIISIHRASNVVLNGVRVFEGHYDIGTTTVPPEEATTVTTEGSEEATTVTTEGSEEDTTVTTESTAEDTTVTTETTQTSTVSTTTEKDDDDDDEGSKAKEDPFDKKEQKRAKRAAIQATQNEFTVVSFNTYDTVTQIAQIELSEDIPEDTDIKIVITFTTTLEADALDGVYLVKYKGKENANVALLATQFESISARKAFPCFDEPGIKASFDLSIHVTGGIEAIANTPGQKNGETKIVFERTPVMSTYLLAFVIYEEAHFAPNAQDNNGNKFRTWAREEAIQNGASLSQRVGPQMLTKLKDYTGIDYYNDMEMKKLDQAAITEFSAGAMENWGLVTYRETALLFKEGESTAACKRVSQIIAHELAHQWFGNWVTTKWWSTIWLNEGFADFFEYIVMHDIYGGWQMLDRMVLDEQMYAFDVDSSATSAPLTDHSVESPASITGHFGTITYSKGGSILRQIRNVMGATEFQDAIKNYLTNMKHKAAVPSDLFEYLLAQNKPDITLREDAEFTAVLEQWTTVAGYPVVRVSRGEEANTMKVTQKRFIQNPGENDPNPLYHIPLTWYTDKATTVPTTPGHPDQWLTTRDDTFTVQEDSEWVILNANQAGYYRVNYDRDMWQKFSDVLWGRASSANLNKVAAIDRAALINNALSLARSGDDEINYPLAVMLIKFLRYDAAFLPWAAARSSLGHVERMLSTSPEYKNYIKFLVEEQYKGKFEDNGASCQTGDENIEMTHRVNFLSLACAAGYDDCITDAEKKLSDYLSDTEDEEDEEDEEKAVPINLQPLVYCYGLKKNTGASLWPKLWEEYATPATQKDATRRGVLTNALGCVNNEARLTEYLTNSLDATKVPRSEAYTVFAAVYSNPDGFDAAVKFLQNNYVGISNAYGTRTTTIINGLANRVTSDNQKTAFETALGDRKAQYSAAVKIAEDNVEWTRTHGDVLKRGMRAASKSAPAMAAASLLTLLCAALLRLFR